MFARRECGPHSANLNAQVAVPALQGDKRGVELAEEFELHLNKIAAWNSPFLERSSGVAGAQEGGT